jgi:hypothetical protein
MGIISSSYVMFIYSYKFPTDQTIQMTMPLPRPHDTPEKNSLVPDKTDDNLESCMTKTQELIQDAINNLCSMTEKLTKMKNSVKATGDDELYGKTPRSVLELNYKFL